MMLETGCRPTTSKAKLRFEAVEFSDIPGQSRLFLQYQNDPVSLRRYYPSVVAAPIDVGSRTGDVLDAYKVDRVKLCEILSEQNRRFGAGPKTIENIERLGREGTVAVLTGQQAVPGAVLDPRFGMQLSAPLRQTLGNPVAMDAQGDLVGEAARQWCAERTRLANSVVGERHPPN
jgi:hypothetical protein